MLNEFKFLRKLSRKFCNHFGEFKIRVLPFHKVFIFFLNQGIELPIYNSGMYSLKTIR